MGEAPSWYRLLKAAVYLKVPPWELAERPIHWVTMAEAAQASEAEAQAIRKKHDQANGN